MNEECKCNGNQEKTLMSEVEALYSSAQRIEDLASFSATLIDKFNRCECPKTTQDPPRLDPSKLPIIGLFDEAIQRLDIAASKISMNISKAIQMIG